MNPILFCLILLALPLRAEETPAASGEVALPWAQFQELLGLDRDTIELSWEEFQRLTQLAGGDTAAPRQVQNGRVVLSRKEFKALLGRLRTPSEAMKAYLTKAVYTGTVGRKSSTIQARLRLQITGRADPGDPLKILLFPGSMAFQDVLWDGRPAVVENEGGWLKLVASETGDHEVTARFSIPHGLDKAPAPLSFSGPSTPITELDMTIPLPNVGVNVAGASHVDTASSGGTTRVRASLPAGVPVSMSWNPVEPAKTKGPAKIYAVTQNVLSVEEDALRVQTQVQLKVLQNAVNTVSLRIPEGFTILDVRGEAVGDWSVRGEEAKVLVVPFAYSREGDFGFTITAEFTLKDKGGAVSYTGFQVLETVRENGFLGVEIKTTAEAKLLDQAGVDRLDVQELPAALTGLAQRPLLYGFRYVRQPYHVNLEIQRHEAVAVVSTVIDQAGAVTLALPDGKRVTSVTYSVRNTWKQFLELRLPAGAQLWSAFVEGRAVRPSKNSAGKILIPLNRSSSINGQLSSFDVEILYFQSGWRFWPVGGAWTTVPVPDVVVSQAFWSVYFPAHYDYLAFGGNVDKEERAQGIVPLARAVLGGKRVLRNIAAQSVSQGAGDYRSQKMARLEQAKSSDQWRGRGDFDASIGVDENTYATQIERELNFFNRVQEQQSAGGAGAGDPGVLPIRISVPNTGEVFRFTKRVLVDETPLRLWTFYVHAWVLKGLLLALLLLAARAALRFRGQLRRWGQQAAGWAAGHEAALAWCASPLGAVLALGGVMIVAFVFSRWLGSLVLVLWIAILGRWAWSAVSATRGKTV